MSKANGRIMLRLAGGENMDDALQRIVLDLRTHAEMWEREALSSSLTERHAKLIRKRATKSRLLADRLASSSAQGVVR